jgi:hypothetical protein
MRPRTATFGAADFLSLAAAPTFAIMALLTGFSDSGAMDALCSAAHGGALLSGMVPMYALMSALHLGPWLRLMVRWRKRGLMGLMTQSLAGSE